MEKVKKITKKDRFNQLLAIPAVNGNDELVEFINHELDLLAKKNTSTGEKKLTPLQIANEGLKSAIIEFMSDFPNELFTVSQLIKKIPELNEFSNQKVSRLANDLHAKGSLDKIVEKRNSYFRIAKDVMVEE